MELVGKQTVCIATHNLPHSTTTWLPRQDQLQEIMEWENNIPTEVVWKLRQFHEYYDPPPCMSTKYYKSQPPNYTLQFTTMEQLWLAFVMKEKYNKIWDKDNWITT